jgi:hypothetical protein
MRPLVGPKKSARSSRHCPIHYFIVRSHLKLAMKRRHFLSLSGLIFGACLIPAGIARRIQAATLHPDGPLILAPENAPTDLYAENTGSGFTLHLGDPNEAPDYPALSEFMEDKGYQPSDDDDLRRYAIEWRGYEEDFIEEEEGAIEQLKRKLNDPIAGGELSHYLEWDFELHESPMARAFHYLSDLPLHNLDGTLATGFKLGGLSFIEGDRPGSNLTYCSADSLQALASLQCRLNELKEGVRIRIR